MEERKFYGIMTIAEDFLRELTLIESSPYGRTEKYMDPKTGKLWLKYISDIESGQDRHFDLMLLSPRPTTDEMINIAFSSPYSDEVSAAITRLYIEELKDKLEYRQEIINRIRTIDIPNLDDVEKKRIRTILKSGRFTDRTNKREIVGKHFSEIQKDVAFFKGIAEYAEGVLKQLS